MFKLICSTFVTLVLFSCSQNEDSEIDDSEIIVGQFSSNTYPQRWQLIQMTGNVADVPPLEGDNLEWQEFYLLSSDRTFLKSRESNGQTSKEKGSYEFTSNSGENYLKLTYDKSSDLIETCTEDLQELLLVSGASKLTGTASACDGPGLIYQRVQ